MERGQINIEYLRDVIIPQRKTEIENGKNLGTAQPIYVVMNMREHIAEGHELYISGTNLKDKEPVCGYLDADLDLDSQEVREFDSKMTDPIPVTKFYTDYPVAFFLTAKAADEYLKYQAHNLSKDAYVYAFYSGYRNVEMDNFLNNG
ncbi:hypothetical protein AGMMS49525_04940 [Bacteroidia bacterium]|nr:hypothetical protein AGMMS49525_04940 [Bacteroidia bacterium]